MLVIVVVLLGGCIQRQKPPTVTECGNQICESGEDGFNCPQDCCVDGDGICRKGCTSVIDDDCVGEKDPYMNHPYPWYDGWWLFCSFDENEYLEGIMSVLVANWDDPDKGGCHNKLFTKEGVYELRLEVPRTDIHMDSDRFNVRLIHDDVIYVSMENKDRYYHIHVEDPENSVIGYFNITPRHLHYWASRYFGTLDSPIEGIVEVGGEKHEITGACSFEHAWGEGTEAPPDAPPKYAYSHYETLILEDSKGTKFGAMHWPWLKTTGEGYVEMPGATNLPDGEYHSYPKSDYTVEYLDKTVIDGFNIPTKWRVIANTSKGILNYTGNARLISKIYSHPTFVGAMESAVHILTDYTGEFIYEDGKIELTGKGVFEFGHGLHDSLYNLDERIEYKFDFGNLTPKEGFKKVHSLTPYGPGGYGFAFSSLDLSGDYDLTEFGNTGMHSDCAYILRDKWIFGVKIQSGVYTVKLYWGKKGEESTQTFNIYDGNIFSDTYELEAENIGDASYPNEATIQHIQIDNGLIVIQMHRNSDIACMISAIEIIRESVDCGNGICEAGKGEIGFNCPEDCCVSGDGICREGCTPKNDDDCETGNLSSVKVASLYEYVSDRVLIGRGVDDVVNLLKETKTDFIFRGWWRWSPCPESPDVTEIPPGYPEWYLGYTKKRAKEGYTYQQLREAINAIKKDNPDVIFCGAIPAQRITISAWNPITEEFIEYPETWEMALDPEKWGIPESKEDFQKRFAIWHGWLEEGEEYDPKQVSSYYPDITNERFQKLFLGWAEKQIDCGADAIWIDMLFEQTKRFARGTNDTNHPAVKESFEAASKMVDEIHKYGESKGKHIYVGSWGSSIIYPYPQPDLDFITASPSSKEVYLMELNETYWDIVTTAVKEKLGDIPFFVFIDWAVSTKDPLGVFSHYLTPEEQREFLGTADEFFQEKGINFIYPVHGGWMGYDTKIFSFGKSSFYDSLAPEFKTYETIKELALNKTKE